MSEINNERDALIRKVVDTLNKKLKKEVASTLSSAFAPEKVTGFVPTGNIALDYVIGKPGFPLGRITEISGAYSSGKCIEENSYVFHADASICKIKDVVKDASIRTRPITNIIDDCLVIDINKRIPKYERVVDVLDQGKQEVYEIVLTNGLSIRATKNHPFLSVNIKSFKNKHNLPFIHTEPWKRLENIKVGDYIAVTPPSFITKFLEDKKVELDDVLYTYIQLCDVQEKELDLSHFQGHTLDNLFTLIYYFLSNKKYKFNYDKPELRFLSKNLQFLKNIQLYLWNVCGFPFSIKSCPKKVYYLYTKDVKVLKKILHFYFSDNSHLLESVSFDLNKYCSNFMYNYSANEKINEDFPNISYLKHDNYLNNYQGLFNFLHNYYWLKIKSITSVGEANTYDLTMETHPYFSANGFIVHNSTISATALGQAQKAGMVTILIDTEHSYDSMWSERYGVNPELLILIQPEHVEEIFDHLRVMLDILASDKKDIPMLTVVDSVSAAATSAELEQEDSTAGKARGGHAKALSEGLRKIGNDIWDKKMALVFISQLKDNPGIMYGSGKHKIGGHAIDFHAGLLLQTRILTRKKINDVPVGQVVSITSTKNKFVPPFRKANFEINYLTGIDNRLTVLEFMAEIGWIKKSGGWFVDSDGNKFRKEGLVDTITPTKIAEVYDYLGITNPNNVKNGNDLMYSLTETIVEGEEVK